MRSRMLVCCVAFLAAACGNSRGGETETAAEDSRQAVESCVPACDDLECGPDGCGGTCGSCPTGTLCMAGACLPDCDLTCADAGLACGARCGESCGECATDETCEEGRCVCAPACPIERCGAGDACGDTCPPCPRAQSCEGCALRLHVVSRKDRPDGTESVVLGLEYRPPQGSPWPSLADLRFEISGAATLERIGVSPELVDAGKEPLADPRTGRRWRPLSDGTLQVLLASTASAKRMAPGPWVYLTVHFRAAGDLPGPATMRLLRRENTLAPKAADQALWGASYGEPVVIWPGETTEPIDAH